VSMRTAPAGLSGPRVPAVVFTGRWGRPVPNALVDASAVVFAAALGGLLLAATMAEEPPIPGLPVGVDLAIGAPACLALLLRRRWPVWVAMSLIGAGLIASSAFGATFVALFTVAVRRSWRVTVAVAAAHLAPIVGLYHLAVPTRQQYIETVVTITLADAAVVAFGMLARSMQERARQAEEGQRLRIEEARRMERERIAREIHDLLAHRISLLTMHAGALEFRPDAPPEQLAQAAGVIRRYGYQALEDLREVIGVLRADAGEDDDAERPQPTLADLPELVGDSRRTGTPVSLDNRVGDLGIVPTGIGRHAYRIVQEGLTNARKHAPGAEVRLAVAGSPGTELTVEVRNRLPAGTGAAEIPGAGAGLIGLAERAGLVGGRLEHGRTFGGDFRLWTSLPWPA
jgi:signal transduction histidine kinase